jgi:hypothetical protein
MSRIRATCPDCGKDVDGSTESKTFDETTTPNEGDLGICLYCAALGIYVENGDGTMGLRAPTLEEQFEYADDSEVVRVRAAIHAMHVLRGDQ